MTTTLKSFDNAIRAVFQDPKFKAQIEWFGEHDVCAQLARQWPRAEMEAFAATGQHVNPERRLSLTVDDPPDFDWWEPRYDQPGRREQTRRREMGVL